jgi:hypothetical protein
MWRPVAVLIFGLLLIAVAIALVDSTSIVPTAVLGGWGGICCGMAIWALIKRRPR